MCQFIESGDIKLQPFKRGKLWGLPLFPKSFSPPPPETDLWRFWVNAHTHPGSARWGTSASHPGQSQPGPRLLVGGCQPFCFFSWQDLAEGLKELKAVVSYPW